LIELDPRITGAVPVPVWGKLETQNPTLSFKDRAMALGVSHARDLGMKGLVVASTGNAAVSASAYAAAAGLECRVLVGSESDAARKLDASRAFGADVEEIPGDYSAAYSAARALEGKGWMNVSTTYRNPLLAEGYRTIAFELIDQLKATPGSVIVPVGAGPLLRGIEGGFRDALTLGYASHMPRLVAVQAAAVAPLAHAWARSDWSEALLEPVPAAPTVATAIADALRGYERQGLLTLEAVKRSSGTALALPEDMTIGARNRLLKAGIWVEPAAATAVAVLRMLTDEWWHDNTGPVVSILTGHGIKAPVPSF
jgi:threonine synthase